MKIDRLLGILILLSKKDKVTAPFLAQYFEVSKRTINRDIETLCMAGVPIITRQGYNGGISIEDGFKFDKNIFNRDELSNMVIGLKAVESVSRDKKLDTLIEKFTISEEDNIDSETVKIDLGSFYKESLTEKIQIIKDAAKTRKRVVFHYYSKNKESDKKVDPYYVLYKWSDWYLYAYSPQKEDFRMFKLARLWDLEQIDEQFSTHVVNQEIIANDEGIFPSNYKLKALFDKSVKYRLIESYGPECYKMSDEGRLLFEMDFTNFEFMISWVLGFGDKAEILEPSEAIIEMKKIISNLSDKYIQT